MANLEIVDAQLILTPHPQTYGCRTDKQIPVWLRLLIAVAMLAVFSVIGGGIWMFGILMFTFALDGANSGDLPGWLEVFMLVGWPISIGLAAVVPALLTACGAKWPRVIVATAALTVLAFAVYVTGVVTLFSSLS